MSSRTVYDSPRHNTRIVLFLLCTVYADALFWLQAIEISAPGKSFPYGSVIFACFRTALYSLAIFRLWVPPLGVFALTIIFGFEVAFLSLFDANHLFAEEANKRSRDIEHVLFITLAKLLGHITLLIDISHYVPNFGWFLYSL